MYYDDWVAAGFAPWRVRPHIDSTSVQVLKIYLSLNEKKKDNIVRAMRQNRTKHVYFSPQYTEGDWRTRNIAERLE